MDEEFGLIEQQAGWRVQGNLSTSEVVGLSYDLIRFVSMEPDGMPVLDHYPKGGKGGEGIQVFHRSRIYQPLTESWVVISTWPRHGFIRINLSSCKTFNQYEVEEWLAERIGPVLQRWSSEL